MGHATVLPAVKMYLLYFLNYEPKETPLHRLRQVLFHRDEDIEHNGECSLPVSHATFMS